MTNLKSILFLSLLSIITTNSYSAVETPNTMVENFIQTCKLYIQIAPNVSTTLYTVDISGNVARGLKLVEFQQQKVNDAIKSTFVFDAPLKRLSLKFNDIPNNNQDYEIKLGFVIKDGKVSDNLSMIQCTDRRLK